MNLSVVFILVSVISYSSCPLKSIISVSQVSVFFQTSTQKLLWISSQSQMSVLGGECNESISFMLMVYMAFQPDDKQQNYHGYAEC